MYHCAYDPGLAAYLGEDQDFLAEAGAPALARALAVGWVVVFAALVVM